MSQQQDSQPVDPLGPWRALRDAGMEAWIKTMDEAVGTDEFTKAFASYLDTYLAASVPFQNAINEYLQTMLPRMGMPTRDDVIDVASRMTNIELRLDDLDAKTDQILDALRALRDQPAQRAAHESATVTMFEQRFQMLDNRLQHLATLLDGGEAERKDQQP